MNRSDIVTNRLKASSALLAVWLTSVCLSTSGCNESSSESAIPSDHSVTSVEMPVLTKEQMYEDFDYLIALVREAYPRRVFKGKLLGFDMLEELGKLRGEIEDLSTTEDFVLLVKRALTLCQDGHTGIWPSKTYDKTIAGLNAWKAQAWEEGERATREYLYATALENAYRAHGSEEGKRLTGQYLEMLDSTEHQVALKLPLVYLGGDYLVYSDFEYKGGHYQKGARLVAVNGEDIDAAVAKLFDQVSLRWDADNGKAFCVRFYRAKKYQLAGLVNLQFEDDSGRTQRDTFDLGDKVVFEKPPGIPGQWEKRVVYLPRHKLLYIRVPRMDTDEATLDYYTAHMTQISRENNIEKVVIDIRGNGGGGDQCWKTIVGMLITEPVQRVLHLALKESELNADSIQARVYQGRDGSETRGSIDRRALLFLDGEEFLIRSLDSPLEPNENSIRFAGVVYVLQDEWIYSSAGAFSSFVKRHKGFVSVGARSQEAGSGFDPFVFSLPHSKLMFWMAANLDVSNVMGVEGLLHSDVEVPVEVPFNELVERMYSERDLYSEEYLLNKDSVFKQVLSLPARARTAPEHVEDEEASVPVRIEECE